MFHSYFKKLPAKNILRFVITTIGNHCKPKKLRDCDNFLSQLRATLDMEHDLCFLLDFDDEAWLRLWKKNTFWRERNTKKYVRTRQKRVFRCVWPILRWKEFSLVCSLNFIGWGNSLEALRDVLRLWKFTRRRKPRRYACTRQEPSRSLENICTNNSQKVF